MPFSDYYPGITRRELGIIITAGIGLGLMLEAVLLIFEKWKYMPIIFLNTIGIVVTALIYWRANRV